MNFSFYVLTNVICKFIGMYSIFIFMRIPGISIFFGREGSGFPIALIVYAFILVSAIIIKFILNKMIDRGQSKRVKLEEIREKILYIICKKKSSYKELLIDYDLDIKTKTYLGSKIQLHKYYTVDKHNNKQKIRILIECKVSDYKQIVFDETYELTCAYSKFIDDIKKKEFI